MVRPLWLVEKHAMLKAIVELDFNCSVAATQLGVSRRKLYYKLEQWGIPAPVGGHLGQVLFSQYRERCAAIIAALDELEPGLNHKGVN